MAEQEGEYQVPVDFGESVASSVRGGGGESKGGSVASSSRVVSAASAPVRLGAGKPSARGSRPRPTGPGSASGGGNGGAGRGRGGGASDGVTAATPSGDVDSFNSSPLLWNSNTPLRQKSRREFEERVRRRRRNRAAQTWFEDGPKREAGPGGPKTKDGPAAAPLASPPELPKPLADLFLRTALFGVDATAQLSGPMLDLAKNTLVPQLVAPLFKEVWEQYAPGRVRTWARVVPPSLRNLADLLWDTDAGRALGERASHLAETAIDVTSSESARQCWIDASVALVKLLEGLHTPEVKALLDQLAVGACRLADVLSSGKAKQLYFDLADVSWALIEAGSDPVMASCLAEGCARVCFALERERESLKKRRGKASSDGVDARMPSSKRRMERDRRQAGTYPPGKRVVTEAGGQEEIDEVLMDALGGGVHRREETQLDMENRTYEGEDRLAEDDGPPQRVIVPTPSSENIEGGPYGEADAPLPMASAREQEAAVAAHGVTMDDGASEITTEIEDLRRSATDRDRMECDDVCTLSSASEAAPPSTDRRDGPLSYEPDDYGTENDALSLQDEADDSEHRPDRPRRGDDEMSEMYDAFDESVLQFYRRLNEVLVETRKESKLDARPPSGRRGRADIDSDEVNGEVDEIDPTAKKDAPSSLAMSLASKAFGRRSKRWRLLVVAMILCVAATCTVWFALGCYGFYVIFFGMPTPLLPIAVSPRQSNSIVIQLVTSKSDNMPGECGADTESASISLDEWNRLKQDVDAVVGKAL